MNKTIEIQSKKKPWSTKDAMIQIYENKLWGGAQFDFYSGDGSHHTNIVTPYVNVLQTFLQSFKTPLTVCDLGCGDFNVGSQLVKYTQKYNAIDIVEALIERNKKVFQNKKVDFNCLDIANDNLPSGNCAILRQVLQHLSNKEVAQVLQKLKKFRYVILTEHLPNGSFESNKDIISGQGIRLKKQSGLNILVAPFNFLVKEEKQLLSTILPDNKGIIVTICYTIF